MSNDENATAYWSMTIIPLNNGPPDPKSRIVKISETKSPNTTSGRICDLKLKISENRVTRPSADNARRVFMMGCMRQQSTEDISAGIRNDIL